MPSPAAVTALPMTNYKPAPEKKVPLNLRVPKSLKRRLEALVRLWVAQAEARKDDPSNVDRTHVATELLIDGIEASFDSFGGEPDGDDGLKAMEKAIREGTITARPSNLRLKKSS